MILGCDGAHRCIGFDFVPNVVPEILKVVFSLKNLRRADGTAGYMAQFNVDTFGTETKMYLDNNDNVSQLEPVPLVSTTLAWATTTNSESHK